MKGSKFVDFTNLIFGKTLKAKIELSYLHLILFIATTLIFLTFFISVAIFKYKRKKKLFISIQQNILNQYNELKIKYEALEKQYQKIKAATSTIKLSDTIWQTEEVSFLFKLHQQLVNVFKIEIASHIIVEQIHKFMNVKKTILLLLDKNTNQLKIASANGLEETEIKNTILKPSESIAGFVITQNRALMVENLEAEHYLKSINRETYLAGNFMCIPIGLENEIFGVLEICSKNTEQLFTKSELLFLENIGKLVATVFKNIFLYQQLNDNYFKTIAALASAIDARDPYTKYHSENVTKYSLLIAEEMKLPYKEIETIKQAALLHDIGKIGIPDAILRKTSQLNDEEYKIMKTHPLKAEEILKTLSFLKEVSLLIRHHHERFDGKGYPDGIAGKHIELGARIIAVADTFDAMTTDRPYRRALTLQEAIDELKKTKNQQLDKEIVDCFIKILETNPQILKKTE